MPIKKKLKYLPRFFASIFFPVEVKPGCIATSAFCPCCCAKFITRFGPPIACLFFSESIAATFARISKPDLLSGVAFFFQLRSDMQVFEMGNLQ